MTMTAALEAKKSPGKSTRDATRVLRVAAILMVLLLNALFAINRPHVYLPTAQVSEMAQGTVQETRNNTIVADYIGHDAAADESRSVSHSLEATAENDTIDVFLNTTLQEPAREAKESDPLSVQSPVPLDSPAPRHSNYTVTDNAGSVIPPQIPPNTENEKSLTAPDSPASSSVTTENDKQQTASQDRKTEQTPSATDNKTILFIPSNFSADRHLHEKVVKSIGGYNVEFSPFYVCQTTSRVQILQETINGTNTWLIQSLNDAGNEKRVGGDEYYITLHTYKSVQEAKRDLGESFDIENLAPLAVARTVDHGNGRYTLDFYTLPTPDKKDVDLSILYDRGASTDPVGYLTIILQYTCGVGAMPTNYKGSWRSGGAVRTIYTEPLYQPPPSIRPCSYPDPSINLTQYSKVLGFGDSVLINLFRYANHTLFRDNTHIGPNLGSDLQMANWETFVHRFKKRHHRDIVTIPNTAVIAGSSTWDLLQSSVSQGYSFDDHTEAVRRLVTTIKQIYPGTTLFWRLPSAVHIQKANDGCMRAIRCNKRVRYISTSRNEHLHRRQAEVMRELNVSVIDFYEAYYSSAHMCEQYDTRHFNLEFNKMIVSWLYQ
jgi:hypothetical protein